MRGAIICAIVILFGSGAIAQVASGGEFVLTQSVVAGGGSSLQSAQFKIGGTSGQGIAGQKASNQSFGAHAGFWIPDALLPTAEPVSLAGRVTTADGRGIQRVRISMTGPDGVIRTTLSSSFGYFRFDNVEVGMMYIFFVAAKGYQFPQPTIVKNILDSLDDLNFVALPN